jgi:cytoskeletal protein CcmA (bactofilin family)
MPVMADEQTESRVGKGTKISGKLNFGALARIEGEVEGEITGKELVVMESAVVNAKVRAHKLIVAGSITGEVIASEAVELMATARAQGSLHTPKLILHEGAIFEGDCKMPRDRAAA